MRACGKLVALSKHAIMCMSIMTTAGAAKFNPTTTRHLQDVLVDVGAEVAAQFIDITLAGKLDCDACC